MAQAPVAKKLSHTDFVRKAITSLRGEKYRGIHTVYSGFNAAFRAYFDGADPVEVTRQMAVAGTIVAVPTKGGVMIYLPEDAPDMRARKDTKTTLKQMGL